MTPSGANAIPYLQRKTVKNDNRTGLHLDKSVNLTLLYSLLVALFCVFGYMVKLNENDTRNEERIAALSKRQDEMREEFKTELKNIKADIKSDMNRFGDKMDRYFKKGN